MSDNNTSEQTALSKLVFLFLVVRNMFKSKPMDLGFFKNLLGRGETKGKDSFIRAQEWFISL